MKANKLNSHSHWDNLINTYLQLTTDVDKRAFLERFSEAEQKLILKLSNLKIKSSKTKLQKSANTSKLTREILTSSKLDKIDLLYQNQTKTNGQKLPTLNKLLVLLNFFTEKVKSLRWFKLISLKKQKKKLENLKKQKLVTTKNLILGYQRFSKKTLLRLAGSLIAIAIIVTSLVYLIPEIQKVFYVYTNNYEQWSYLLIDEPNRTPNADADGDGLTNYEEFLLTSNPTNPDSNQNQILDGLDVLLDLNLGNFQTNPKTVINKQNLFIRLKNLQLKQTKQTNSANNSNLNISLLSINPAKPGWLLIPKLNNNQTSINWKINGFEPNLETDLQNQWVHLNESDTPADVATKIYLFGLSQNSPLRQNQFKDIAQLTPESEIYLYAYDFNDSLWEWKYLVVSNNIVALKDIIENPMDHQLDYNLFILTFSKNQGTPEVIIIGAKFVNLKKVVETVNVNQAEENS
jgi:hypothetical protein